MTHILTGDGDLMMDAEIKPHIGEEVDFIKITKSGLCQIKTSDGKLFSVPQRNLKPL